VPEHSIFPCSRRGVICFSYDSILLYLICALTRDLIWGICGLSDSNKEAWSWPFDVGRRGYPFNREILLEFVHRCSEGIIPDKSRYILISVTASTWWRRRTRGLRVAEENSKMRHDGMRIWCVKYSCEWRWVINSSGIISRGPGNKYTGSCDGPSILSEVAYEKKVNVETPTVTRELELK
jgi:hypothetical protein